MATVPTEKAALKAIDAKIATFRVNRDKLKKLGHEIAVLIMSHANTHGDCTRALKLAGEFPKSWQPQIAAWFKAFSPIRVVVVNGKCEYDPAYKKLSPKDKLDWWKLDEAEATPFWEVLKEPEAAKVMDFEALMKLVKHLGSKIEKQINEGNVKPEDTESAKALVIQLEGLKVERVKVNPASNANDSAAVALPEVGLAANAA